MRQEKALRMALKIVETCKHYGEQGRCTQCPFSFKGCILTNGDNIPAEWIASDLVNIVKIRKD